MFCRARKLERSNTHRRERHAQSPCFCGLRFISARQIARCHASFGCMLSRPTLFAHQTTFPGVSKERDRFDQARNHQFLFFYAQKSANLVEFCLKILVFDVFNSLTFRFVSFIIMIEIYRFIRYIYIDFRVLTVFRCFAWSIFNSADDAPPIFRISHREFFDVSCETILIARRYPRNRARKHSNSAFAKNRPTAWGCLLLWVIPSHF